jgi:hypothetical protein
MTAQPLTLKLVLRQQAQRPNLRNSTYLKGGYEIAAQAAAIGSPIYQKLASLLFLPQSQSIQNLRQLHNLLLVLPLDPRNMSDPCTISPQPIPQ